MKYGRADDFDDDTTDEQWAKVRALAEKGNADKLIDYLYDIGTISPLAAKLFILAVAEYNRLRTQLVEAEGISGKVADLTRDLEFAQRSTQAIDPKEARERVDAIEIPLRKLKDQRSYAEVARVHYGGVARRFPRLFSVPVVGEGSTAHYPPVVDQAPPALQEALMQAALPETAIDPWRFYPSVQLPIKNPAKRVASPLTIGADE